MAVNTFSITSSDVASRVQGLVITAATSPTVSQVEDLILFTSAEIANEANAVGIDTELLLDDTDATYLALKNAVIYKVVAELQIARNKGSVEAGEYWISRYKEIIETLRRKPLAIQPDRGEGPNQAYSLNLDAQNIFNVGYYRTLNGRIVLGGGL